MFRACVGCGVCDTLEFWRGAAGLCARVRSCAGAAEYLLFTYYVHTYTYFIFLSCLCAPPAACRTYAVRYGNGGGIMHVYEYPLAPRVNPTRVRVHTGQARGATPDLRRVSQHQPPHISR